MIEETTKWYERINDEWLQKYCQGCLKEPQDNQVGVQINQLVEFVDSRESLSFKSVIRVQLSVHIVGFKITGSGYLQAGICCN